jgi:DNA-binding NtrC family response regulator
LRQAKSVNPDITAVVMTGYGSIQTAVTAMKEGAYHYVTKPFELDDIRMIIERALEHKRLKNENQLLLQQVKERFGVDSIIGASEEIQSVLRLVRQVADTDSAVLILGEPGTGKEMVAQAIHCNSRRAEHPLVTMSCASIPENVLEAELYGYVKGAFPGANSAKTGKIEVARGGTLFIDEVGELSPRMQIQLLRVMQERKYEPVGSSESVEANVRILASSQQNLEQLVVQGKFREDLFYRLNVIPISVPALRSRNGDISLLVDYFTRKYALANKLNPPRFSQEVMSIFNNYRWPGNVRELENTVERLVVLKPGRDILISDLPDKFLAVSDTIFKNAALNIPESGLSLKNAVDDFENTLILKALEKTNWNKNKAANLLKLNRTTLVEKIKKKRLSRPSASKEAN